MVIGGILIILALTFLISYELTGNVVKEDTIKVGAIFPLTGQASSDGNNAINGIKIAIKEINANGGLNGKKVELVAEDSNSDDSKTVISAYRSLKSRDIDLIIGPLYSPAGQALSPITCSDKSILIAPAIGIKGFTSEKCNYTFDMWPEDYINSRKFGDYIVESGYRKIAIIGSTQSWCNEQAEGVREGIIERNGEIVSYIIVDDSNKDFLTEIAKINNAKPDAVVFTNYFTMNIVAKKLREYGNDANFFTVLLNQKDIDNAAGAFENAISISSFTPIEEFSNKFEKEYGKTPGFPADTSYDSMMWLAKAMKETKSTDPTEIQKYLHTLKDYDGASGSLTFDGNGGITKEQKFYIVKNGKLEEFNI